MFEIQIFYACHLGGQTVVKYNKNWDYLRKAGKCTVTCMLCFFPPGHPGHCRPEAMGKPNLKLTAFPKPFNKFAQSNSCQWQHKDSGTFKHTIYILHSRYSIPSMWMNTTIVLFEVTKINFNLFSSDAMKRKARKVEKEPDDLLDDDPFNEYMHNSVCHNDRK